MTNEQHWAHVDKVLHDLECEIAAARRLARQERADPRAVESCLEQVNRLVTKAKIHLRQIV